MGDKEDFEKWARDQGISLLPAPFQIGAFSNQVTEMAFRAWQARQPEIAALKEQHGLCELALDSRDGNINTLIKENAALKAEVEKLRNENIDLSVRVDALDDLLGYKEDAAMKETK